MKLSLLVVGKSPADLEEFSEKSPLASKECVQLVLLPNPGRCLGGQASIGNKFAQEASGDVIGMVHADTVFPPGDLERLGNAASGRKVCGIVGRSLNTGIGINGYVWGRTREGETPVSTLDACSVFFRKDAGLLFDEQTFDGFHCVVEDFCLAAQAKGIPIVVPALKGADHIGKSVYVKEWQEEYQKYRNLLSRKWPKTIFSTT